MTTARAPDLIERVLPINLPPNPFYVVVPATAYELSVTPDGQLRLVTPDPEPEARMVIWLQWRMIGERPVGALSAVGEYDGWALWHIEAF